MNNFNDNLKSTWRDSKHHFLEVLNSKWYKVLFSIQNTIYNATTIFYMNNSIKTILLPITTGAVSSPMGLGSDSLPVQVEIGGHKIFLADSMQFLLEYGCRLNKNGVYYFMPSFRGENVDERHLSQFFHSEVEIPGTLSDIQNLAEKYIIFLSEEILKHNATDLESIGLDLCHINNLIENRNNIPQISFSEAISLIESKGVFSKCVKLDLKNGIRIINSYGEKVLIDHFGGFIWLTNFEHKAIPFYQAYSENENYAMNADLLFGIGEVIGSGQRHSNHIDTIKSLKEHNVKISDYKWYCELKEKYPMKTSGFGMGVERFLLWIFKHNDIRDMQLFLRFNGEPIYV